MHAPGSNTNIGIGIDLTGPYEQKFRELLAMIQEVERGLGRLGQAMPERLQGYQQTFQNLGQMDPKDPAFSAAFAGARGMAMDAQGYARRMGVDVPSWDIIRSDTSGFLGQQGRWPAGTYSPDGRPMGGQWMSAGQLQDPAAAYRADYDAANPARMGNMRIRPGEEMEATIYRANEQNAERTRRETGALYDTASRARDSIHREILDRAETSARDAAKDAKEERAEDVKETAKEYRRLSRTPFVGKLRAESYLRRESAGLGEATDDEGTMGASAAADEGFADDVRGEAGAGGRGGRGAMIGRLAMIHMGVDAANQAFQQKLQNERTGRQGRLSDYGDLIGSGAGLLAGMALAPVMGPAALPVTFAMMAAGGSVGNYWKGNALNAEDRQSQSFALRYFSTPDQADFLKYHVDHGGTGWAGPMFGAASQVTEAMNMAGASGPETTRWARGLVQNIEGKARIDDPSGKTGESLTGAIASAMMQSPELTRQVFTTGPNGQKFNYGSLSMALRLGGPSAGEAYATNNEGTPLDVQMAEAAQGRVDIARQRLAIAGSGVTSAAAETNLERAGGASASAVYSGGIAQQKEALQGAIQAQRDYIETLKGTAEQSTYIKAQIAEANAAIKGLSAGIAQLTQAGQAAIVSERQGWSDTRISAASAQLGIGVATASASTDDVGFDALLSGVGSDLSQANRDMRLKGQPQAYYQAIQQRITADTSRRFGIEQQRAAFLTVRPTDLAAMNMDFARSGRAIDLLTETDPNHASALREANAYDDLQMARGYAASARAMGATGRFSAEQLRARRNQARDMRLRSDQETVANLRFTETPMMEAEDAGWQERIALAQAGGEGSLVTGREAFGAYNLAGIRSGQAASHYGFEATLHPELAGRAAGMESLDAWRRRAAQLQMAQTAGRFTLPVGEQEKLDQTAFSVDLKRAYPFTPGSNMTAELMELFRQLGSELKGMDTQESQLRKQFGNNKPALDLALHELNGSRRGVQLQQANVLQELDEGWIGRIAEASYNAPTNRFGTVPTFRDVLKWNPHAGRYFGSGSKDETDRQRDFGLFAATPGVSSPQSLAAQEMKLVVEIQDGRDGFSRTKQAEVRYQVGGSGGDAVQRVTIDRTGGR